MPGFGVEWKVEAVTAGVRLEFGIQAGKRQVRLVYRNKGHPP